MKLSNAIVTPSKVKNTQSSPIFLNTLSLKSPQTCVAPSTKIKLSLFRSYGRENNDRSAFHIISNN